MNAKQHCIDYINNSQKTTLLVTQYTEQHEESIMHPNQNYSVKTPIIYATMAMTIGGALRTYPNVRAIFDTGATFCAMQVNQVGLDNIQFLTGIPVTSSTLGRSILVEDCTVTLHSQFNGDLPFVNVPIVVYTPAMQIAGAPAERYLIGVSCVLDKYISVVSFDTHVQGDV